MALEEVHGSLSRVADQITSTPKEPCEPVREPPPLPNIKQIAIVAPRTPKTTNGGSNRAQCTGGDDTVFPAQDVRFKQGILKLEEEATPAGDRLRRQQEEKLHSQVGGTTNPGNPCPEHHGVFCIPLCHL